MVYASVPNSYVDPPPLNWNLQQQQEYPQQQNHHDQQARGNVEGIITTGAVTDQSNQHRFQTPPPPPSSSSSTVRRNSMVDRARQAKLPPPKQAVKCPRCDSINTKFCYYNNYSLSQPRHFCKTCRRYWTHGGAIRNVPVGGGFRRNNRRRTAGKRTSSSTSASITNKASSSSNLANRIPLMINSLPDFGMTFPSAGGIGLNYNFTGMQSTSGDHAGGGPTSYPITGGGTGVDFNNWSHQQMQPLISSLNTSRLIGQQTTPGGLMYPQHQEESDSVFDHSQRPVNLQPKQDLTGNGDENLAGDAASGGAGRFNWMEY